MTGLALLPARVRLALYLAYAAAALVVTSTGIFYTAVHEATPKWVAGAVAVLGSIAAPFGALAAANVNKANVVAVAAVTEESGAGTASIGGDA